MSFEELIKQLKSGELDGFALFGVTLGELMAKGLNQLKPDDQKFVTEAINDGGEVLAICRPLPLSVLGVLNYQGKQIELFNVTEETIWN